MEEEITSSLKEISVSLFTELSEGDKQYLAKDLASILSSSPLHLIKNLEDLYDSLVECKNSIQQVDFFDEFSENQGYQKALQKLDSQIRNHIKQELQMKVYIDALEEKISKAQSQRLNSLESNYSIIEKLKDDNKQIRIKIAMKNAEIAEIKNNGSSPDEKELAQIRLKFQKDSEKIAELERNIQKLKLKWSQAKVELDLKNKEYEKHKTDFLNLKKGIISVEERINYSQVDKSDRVFKESFDALLKSKRISKTPTKFERSISPLPYSHQQKSIQGTKITQSTKKLEKSPLAKILKTDLSRYKSKTRLPIFSIQKK